MSKRILTISFIYACTAIGWFILAGFMFARTETQDKKLRSDVGQLWGTKQTQQAPSIYGETATPNASKTERCFTWDSSNIEVDLKLEHRKKGLIWYSAYYVDFSGKYQISNKSDKPQEMTLDFVFPAKEAVYDDFYLIVGKVEVNDISLKS
ncbi:MAG: hypothetical protein ACYSSI_05275, partial [Planctomycetota bacterium]